MVFEAVVLHPRRHPGRGSGVPGGVHFQRRVRPQSAGQLFRPDQAPVTQLLQRKPGTYPGGARIS